MNKYYGKRLPGKIIKYTIPVYITHLSPISHKQFQLPEKLDLIF